MDVEETTQVTEEERADELETSEEDTTELEEGEETTDETVEEKPDETVSEEEEYTDDFREWAESHGTQLPDSIDSAEALLESYNATLPEMKRAQTEAKRFGQIDTAVRARGFNGVEDFLQRGIAPQGPQPNAPQTQTGNAPELPTYTKQTQFAIQNGQIHEDYADIALAQAQINDQVLNQVYQIMGSIYNMADGLTGKVDGYGQESRTREYAEFAGSNKGFAQKELDDIRANHNIADYETAAAFLAMKDPARFGDIKKTITDKAEKKFRKKLRMTKVQRGKKGRGPGGGGRIASLVKQYARGSEVDQVGMQAALARGDMTDAEFNAVCDFASGEGK